MLVSSFLVKSRYKTTLHSYYEESVRTVNKILKVPRTQQEFRWWGDIIRESLGVSLGDLGWHVFRDSDLSTELAVEA